VWSIGTFCPFPSIPIRWENSYEFPPKLSAASVLPQAGFRYQLYSLFSCNAALLIMRCLSLFSITLLVLLAREPSFLVFWMAFTVQALSCFRSSVGSCRKRARVSPWEPLPETPFYALILSRGVLVLLTSRGFVSLSSQKCVISFIVVTLGRYGFPLFPSLSGLRYAALCVFFWGV